MLSITPNAFDGAHMAFGRWRNLLAIAAGYEMAPVKVVLPDGRLLAYDEPQIDWDRYGTDEHLLGEWDLDDVPADPLVVLLCHFDNKGVIRPAQAGPLRDRLYELLPALPAEDIGDIEDVHRVTRRFAAACQSSAASGEPLVFNVLEIERGVTSEAELQALIDSPDETEETEPETET